MSAFEINHFNFIFFFNASILLSTFCLSIVFSCKSSFKLFLSSSEIQLLEIISSTSLFVFNLSNTNQLAHKTRANTIKIKPIFFIF
jgi:hypothetical protein